MMQMIVLLLLVLLPLSPVRAQDDQRRSHEVTFRLTVRGEPPAAEAFEVTYYVPSSFPQSIPLCGTPDLLDSGDASVSRCRGGGTYTRTVVLPADEEDTVHYDFVNVYRNERGKRVSEAFAGSGGQFVPTGATYSATYTYPPGVSREQATGSQEEPSRKPYVVGTIASDPAGRVEGVIFVEGREGETVYPYIPGEDPGRYHLIVSYTTRLLRREGKALVPVTYRDLAAGQKVRTWASVERLSDPPRANAEVIVVTGESRNGQATGKMVPAEGKGAAGVVVLGTVAIAALALLGIGGCKMLRRRRGNVRGRVAPVEGEGQRP